MRTVTLVAGNTSTLVYEIPDSVADSIVGDPTVTILDADSGAALDFTNTPVRVDDDFLLTLEADELPDATIGHSYKVTWSYVYSDGVRDNTITDRKSFSVVESLAAAPELTVGTNTYIDLEDAEDYFDTRFGGAAWQDATDEEKAQALIIATRHVDSLFLRGEKYETSQALAFPRTYLVNEAPIQRERLYDADATYTESSVPDQVKDAVCEEALSILDRTSEARARLQAQGVTSVKIGDVSETYALSSRLKLLSDESSRLIRPYIAGAVSMG